MTAPSPSPTGKLSPQDWMAAEETRAVFAALQADGREARFIGGCVRNAIFGLPVTDIDIATPERPERVIELLEAAGIKAIPTGIDHGTITAVVGDRHFEVTTLRVDVDTDGRRARVAYTDDWLADAHRRDFTINTLSCTLEGDIYDPLTGMEDLGNRWVRFVGLPKDRIEEDVLRLLRFFRFQATFGAGGMDRDALAACRLLAPRLKELSRERVRSELFRILDAPNPAETFLLMKGERVLEQVLPEAVNFGRLRMMAWLETTAIRVSSVTPNTLRRLAAILENDETGHKDLADRLRLSNAQTDRLAVMTGGFCSPTPELNGHDRQMALYDLGVDNYRDLVLLQWAGEMASEPRHHHTRTEAWLALVDEADVWVRPEFPLRGKDALDLGVEHGPKVGDMLKSVEQWWRDQDFKAGREKCLEKLKSKAGV